MGQNKKIIVMASGTGSILKALIAAELPIVAVVTDRKCPAEDIARDGNIKCIRVTRDSFGETFDRKSYTDKLLTAILEINPDLIAMAGFGTVLSEDLEKRFPNRVLNTHPSLLPLFKGWHAVRDALAADVKVTGCTIHIATAELDAGPILYQQEVPIMPGDSEESLHKRIKEVEKIIYPKVIRQFLDSDCNLQPMNIELH